jgi:Uma2 family endonuclease
MAALRQSYVTPEEYLALERQAETKNEYYNGQIYAMSGASRNHNVIAFNLASIIGTQLRGRPCEAYVNDMRVLNVVTGSYMYPDLVALCGKPEFEDNQFDTLTNPEVIIEVLSPSTEAHDRGAKFAHYRRLPSLHEYLLIAQDKMSVERYVRSGEHWIFKEFTHPNDVVKLESISCDLPLDAIYEKVELTEEHHSTN